MMHARRHFLIGLGGVVLSSRLPAFASSRVVDPSIITIQGQAFGTQWQLTLPETTKFTIVVTEVQQIIESINGALSPWRNGSEITAFNLANTEDWVPVSDICSDVIQTALDVSRESRGHFDPTVGPIVHQYGFGPVTGDIKPDYRQIVVQPGAIRKDRPGLTLDPCGIAKGFALDLIINTMQALNLPDHLLELGGELRVSGHHPSGRDWLAGIESPDPDQSELLVRVSNLQGKALATSGTRHNSYTIGDQRYSHIIDTRRSGPISSKRSSVSVIADTAMLADAWSTALMAAGEDTGLAIARREGISAFFVTSNHDQVSRQSTAGFVDCLVHGET